MSEKLPGSAHEHLPSREAAHERGSEKAPAHHEHHHHKADKEAEVEKARQSVEQAAEKAAERPPAPETSDSVHAPRQTYVNKELKEMAYSRLLNRARKQLPMPARTFSKFIHQPVVNATSEALGRTIGRPSGIFGGGLVALVGTSAYYFLTKHYGYNYNYFLFVILLALGFAAGWFVELSWKLTRAAKK